MAHRLTPAEFRARTGLLLDQMRGYVEDYGHALQHVFGTESDGLEETFTYTCGLTEKGLPELWLGTMGQQQGGMILNAIVDRARRGPEDPLELLVPGEMPWFDEYSVAFRLHGPVSLEAASVGMAKQLAAVVDPTLFDDVRVLQVLWPDDDGHFPGEDGYDQARFPQKVLPLAAEAGV